jgi:hypothetical protein
MPKKSTLLPPPMEVFARAHIVATNEGDGDEDEEPIPPTRRPAELVAYQDALDEVDAAISWSPTEGWSHDDVTRAFGEAAIDDDDEGDEGDVIFFRFESESGDQDQWMAESRPATETPTVRSPSTVRLQSSDDVTSQVVDSQPSSSRPSPPPRRTVAPVDLPELRRRRQVG